MNVKNSKSCTEIEYKKQDSS